MRIGVLKVWPKWGKLIPPEMLWNFLSSSNSQKTQSPERAKWYPMQTINKFPSFHGIWVDEQYDFGSLFNLEHRCLHTAICWNHLILYNHLRLLPPALHLLKRHKTPGSDTLRPSSEDDMPIPKRSLVSSSKSGSKNVFHSDIQKRGQKDLFQLSRPKFDSSPVEALSLK